MGRLRVLRFRLVVCAILVLVLVPGALASSHGGTMVSKTYVGTAWILPTCHAAWPAGVGGVCFDRLPGSTHVSVLLNDDSGFETAGYVVFRNADGPLLSEMFCLSYARSIPAGTTLIQVNVQDSAVAFAMGCGVTAATTGSVMARFT